MCASAWAIEIFFHCFRPKDHCYLLMLETMNVERKLKKKIKFTAIGDIQI